jgi:glucan phosphoethanolaminetransferase (alkaline phosphatase superfamily)
LLLPLIAVTPMFLFSTIYFGVPPGFELVAFVMQTNAREAREAIHPFLIYLVPFVISFISLYLFSVCYLAPQRIPLRIAGWVSAVSFTLLLAITFYVNALFYKSASEINKYDLVLKYEYPVTLLSGLNDARIFLNRNHLRKAENFSFRAVKQDSLRERQVHVLIIGESSRFDRWQINGYNRETSPGLASEENLITYSDVVAGAHYTWVSVPQIITRANPDNYDAQYREKSILAAFKEAGFKTFWLSNQSDQDMFWSGSIILHARTADVYSFSPTYSPNLEFENIYDGRLLPILDSILLRDDRNLFIVLHTMGSHWEYSRRYPPEFDVFQPSGYTQSINPPDALHRDAILNSYDNSILYADHFIHSVITSVKTRADVAVVTYISDHGEDLFDRDPGQMDFHFRPSAATLRVPLFVWTSASYNNIFPQKRRNLEANRSEKIGTENIFYTLLDIANIRTESFDSTKSFANGYFLPSQQKFYGDDEQARSFNRLP